MGPGEINIKGEIRNKWVLNEINISDIFFQFRQSTITKASDGSIEGTSEILALNHIFFDSRLREQWSDHRQTALG